MERLLPATRTRIDAALSSSDVDRAFDAAFDRIAADPAVASAAGAVFQHLGDDPGIEKAGGPILQELAKSPDFRGWVERIRLEHPSDFEHALDQSIGRRFESPRVDQAINASTEALMASPRVQAAISDFSNVLLHDGKIEAAFTRSLLRVVSDPDRLARIAKKLGVEENDPKFEDRLGAFLTEPARLNRLLATFAKLFGDHPAPRQAIAGMLAAPSFASASVGPLTRLLGDETFRARAVIAIVAVVTDQPELEARVNDAMTCPGAERAVIEWLTALEHAPEITRAFSEAFQKVAESPELGHELEEIYAGG